MQFIAAWYSPFMAFRLFQVSSAAYKSLLWTIAICRFRAEAGGTPYLAVSRWTLASA